MFHLLKTNMRSLHEYQTCIVMYSKMNFDELLKRALVIVL